MSILLFHITVALLSIITTTIISFAPSKRLLRVTTALFLLTTISGTALIALLGSSLSTCLLGSAYIGITLFCMYRARKDLVTQHIV